MKLAAPLSIRSAMLLATLAWPSLAIAQQVERDALGRPIEIHSIVVIDGQITKDAVTPSGGSGLTLNARVETQAETARRDAADLLDGGAVGARPLELGPDTQTVVEARGVVSESATPRAKACVQIGVIGAQAECRPN